MTTTTTSDHAHAGDHTSDHAGERGRTEGTYAGEDTFRYACTSVEACQEWLDAYEQGVLDVPAPLSGEWAGESLSELGMSTWDEEMLQAYEEAWTGAYMDTVRVLCEAVVQQ